MEHFHNFNQKYNKDLKIYFLAACIFPSRPIRMWPDPLQSTYKSTHYYANQCRPMSEGLHK